MAFFNTNGMGNDLLNSALNTGASFLTAIYNNKQAEKREKTARKENFEYGEKAADAADARARAQYNDLYSIKAQMQMAKEAGLSPSVYASGGLQGQQGHGAQGTGASGISPTIYGVNPVDFSQIQLNNALAGKAEAEEENTKQDTLLKQQQTTQQELLNFITEQKGQFDIEQAKELANMYRMQAQLTATKNKRENIFLQYDDEKTQAEIAEMKERTNNIIQDTGLKLAQEKLAKSQIELNKKQEEALSQQIKASIEQTRQKWDELDIARKSQEAQETWFEEQAKNLTNLYNAKCEELKIAQAKLDNEDSRAYERLIIDMYLGDKESFSKSFGTPYTSTSRSGSGLSKDAKKGMKEFQLRKPKK